MENPTTLPAADAGSGEDKRTGVESYRQGLVMAFLATAVALVIFIFLTIYDPPRTGRLSLGTEIAMVAGITAFVCLICLFGAVQRVEIHHDQHVIRVANKDTNQRWLSFRIDEVVRIRRLDGYRMDALAMDLRTAQDRSSQVAIFNNELMASDDHSALFVALVTAVVAVNPEVEMTGFSAISSGYLRRPAKHPGSR